MRSVQYIIGSTFCIFLGAWASIGGLNLKLFDLGVPASGLFPFLFGTVLVVIGLVSLSFDVLNYKAQNTGERTSFNYLGARRVLSYFGFSIACVLLIPNFGFVIPCFCLLMVLFKFVENINWRPSLYVAIGFTMFCDILFIRTLGVQLESFKFLELI